MIVFDFDHHVCTRCRGLHQHRIGQVCCGTEAVPEFMLKCTHCGDQDGPFVGERYRNERGDFLPDALEILSGRPRRDHA
jgi:hypothetical protein